ncbi:tetratricopeptide repeat protein, partial [Planctomycetota bacterium]
RKPATVRAGTQISSSTQSKIGRSIGSTRNERAAESNRVRISSTNRISSAKTSPIASPIRSTNIVERRKNTGNLLDNTRNNRSKGETKPGRDRIKPEKSVRDEFREKSGVTRKLQEKGPKAVLEHKKAELRTSEKKSGGPSRKKAISRERAISAEPKRGKDNRDKMLDKKPVVPRNRGTVRPRKDTSIAGRSRHRRRRYEEQRNVVTNIHRQRHMHTYRDRYHRICNRIVWPRYHFPVYYSCGPYFTFRYVYPYYHRRYIFVSLGGYWPSYSYMRYYWYGYHPYEWYGYYPVAQEVQHDTYNYYTYNYYYNDSQGVVSGEPAGTLRPVDENTFADVRERLAQQQAEEPDAQTLADTYFEDAVKAFEKGDYGTAAELFAKAMELAPEDVILPFAFAQALFAAEQYTDSAEVLRLTLASISPEEEGVFYPRGLYPEEEILFEQIDVLAEKAALNRWDLNLQLLLGYNLLGIGELEEALEPLQLAASDKEIAGAAEILLGLLEKLRTAETEGQ